MAKLTFRQGIIRAQTGWLQSNGNYVSLVASNSPVQFTVAHYDQNYLFAENQTVTQAWGPLTGAGTKWLYWDININTGAITRGYTSVTPIFQPSQPTAGQRVEDLHWFDTVNFIMKVRKSNVWQEKIRVFAGSITGSTITPYTIGSSQVGINNVTAHAGYPIFATSSQLPVKIVRADRKPIFVHTEMPLYSQFSNMANFRIDTPVYLGEAYESIAQHYAVAFIQMSNTQVLGLARNTEPLYPAVGLASEHMNVGDVRSIITYGLVESTNWEWDIDGSAPTQPIGTPLFVGENGEITATPPQTGSIQRIGTIAGRNSVFVNPQPIITYG